MIAPPASRPRLAAGLTAAAAVCLLALDARGTPGPPAPPPGGGGGSVTVDVSDTEVLVGHEVTMTATVDGPAIGGTWFEVCPGGAAPRFVPRFVFDETNFENEACFGKVGAVDHGYKAEFQGGGTAEDRKTVTVVGPNAHQTGRYGEASQPYPVYPNTQVANLITYLHDGSALVGPCAEVTKVEAKTFVWDMQEGYYVKTADWAEVGWLSWVVKEKEGKAYLDHHFGAHCADIDAVAVGEPCGPALRFEYRVTFAGGCGADDFEYVTAPGVVAQPYRTGPCQYELRTERSDF